MLEPEVQQEVQQETKKRLSITRLVSHIQGGELFRLYLKNFFLRVITLNMYMFWAKTRVRQYIMSSFEIKGQSFEYTGTAKELIKGFAKACILFLILIPIPLIVTMMNRGNAAGGRDMGQIACLLIIVIFVPLAVFFAVRFRLSRTKLNAIRFSYQQKWQDFYLTVALPFIINYITFGLAAPWLNIQSWTHFINSCAYGNQRFSYNPNGKANKLLSTHIKTWLLAIPTLTFSRLWYRAALREQKCAGLSLGELRFKSTATGRDYLNLMLGNLFLILFTLGLGKAWVIKRNADFFVKHTFIGGDYDAFIASQNPNDKTGALGDDIANLDDFIGL